MRITYAATDPVAIFSTDCGHEVFMGAMTMINLVTRNPLR